ncbi:MAG: hypothetical protein IGBAC_1389 [Ignavibacteriae bacterium]|nr:MAG: hypothetical protein IGBAC_1389 [Ignavibacteriota bacterium]
MVKFIEKSGESIEEAIIILDASDSWEGIYAEYEYISKKFGRQNSDWVLESQSLLRVDEKTYDKMEVKLADGTKKILYFDITQFY